MWRIVCPALYAIPAVRESPTLSFILSSGSDKLFISPERILQSGGHNADLAHELSAGLPKTVVVGLAVLGVEVVLDLTRCVGEYYLQKKQGVIPDGVARAVGQTRPFIFRFSTLEAYQKIIGYAAQPWKIGTPEQIFSSIQGSLGSIWRGLPQFGLVLAVGKHVDNFLKWISQKTGLDKIASKWEEEAKKKQEDALKAISNIVGDNNVKILRAMLEAEEKRTNPFTRSLEYKDIKIEN
jgi:hypothetical protein